MDTQERKILYYLLLSSLLLAVIFAVFLLNLARNYKRNQRLQREVTGIELNTLEKERSRIKADLHDEIAPLALTTQTLISNIVISRNQDRILAETALNNLRSLREKLQAIAFDLIPASLLRKGLIAAVDELIAQMQICTSCSLYFIHPPELPLYPDTQLHLYRIIKEALFNTIKYAEAWHCNVEIQVIRNKVQLSIIDDGKGFQLPLVARGGLNNIALRTELLKGKLYINSAPAHGTTITIHIPLTQSIQDEKKN
jgi:signal transduction histidine kinase